MPSNTARAAVLALAVVAASLGASARADGGQPPVKGIVGVCIRWGDDPVHVQEAVVVEPSRNAALNQAIPAHVRAMNWPKPPKDYYGQWEGVNLVFGDVSPDRGVPDCKSLNRSRLTQ
jgi:hypothetical protein